MNNIDATPILFINFPPSTQWAQLYPEFELPRVSRQTKALSLYTD